MAFLCSYSSYYVLKFYNVLFVTQVNETDSCELNWLRVRA